MIDTLKHAVIRILVGDRVSAVRASFYPVSQRSNLDYTRSNRIEGVYYCIARRIYRRVQLQTDAEIGLLSVHVGGNVRQPDSAACLLPCRQMVPYEPVLMPDQAHDDHVEGRQHQKPDAMRVGKAVELIGDEKPQSRQRCWICP